MVVACSLAAQPLIPLTSTKTALPAFSNTALSAPGLFLRRPPLGAKFSAHARHYLGTIHNILNEPTLAVGTVTYCASTPATKPIAQTSNHGRAAC